MPNGITNFCMPRTDPDASTQMLPFHDCGDGLNPSALGYLHMDNMTDLSLFD